jgi:ABC transporter substrate binding protein (PQQ-dependent alcohol dehydrogenase system)
MLASLQHLPLHRPLFLLALLGLCAAPEARAQAPLDTVHIAFISKTYPEAPSVSMLDQVIPDEGLQGARVALGENELTGKFLGRHYQLDEITVPEGGDLAAAAAPVLARGEKLIVADLEAADLLALAGIKGAEDAIILDARTSDIALRQASCRANLFHILPDRAMRADALAQYLMWKKWRRWFLIKGTTPADEEYAQAIKRSATRFGGKIVEERSYAYDPGSRRTDTGHEQIQTQMPLATQGAPDHDVLIVADVEGSFGDYLPYNTTSPRPVAGTQGLIAVAWHRSVEEYSASQMQHRFNMYAKRDMTERDYGAWLAVRTFGEAVIRSGKSDVATLKSYMLSDKFEVAGFKGEGLTFRRWDQQLRQPILIAWARMHVSISPQEGYLHERFTTDTLGFDEPETQCHLQKPAEEKK